MRGEEKEVRRRWRESETGSMAQHMRGEEKVAMVGIGSVRREREI